MMLTALVLASLLADPGAEQEAGDLDATVVHLLLGEPGRLYHPPRPDVRKLGDLGDRIVPVLLRHAHDRSDAPEKVARVLLQFLQDRLTLHPEGRAWLIAEFNRGTPNLYVIAAAGLIGEPSILPKLAEEAAADDERRACVAVQAMAAVGTSDAFERLAVLATSVSSPEARRQAAFLLERLHAPFQGAQADPRMLQVFEKDAPEPLTYAIGGWGFYAPDHVLRRWIRAKRTDLLPKLREIADRHVAANPAVVENATTAYLRALQGIHLLGGSLSEAELKLLADRHAIERPEGGK